MTKIIQVLSNKIPGISLLYLMVFEFWQSYFVSQAVNTKWNFLPPCPTPFFFVSLHGPATLLFY